MEVSLASKNYGRYMEREEYTSGKMAANAKFHSEREYGILKNWKKLNMD